MSVIDGVLLTNEKRIPHPKGDLLHCLRLDSPGMEKFGEAYFSFINQNEIKGWKIHHRVVCNLFCPTGQVKFVLYDARENSNTKGQFFECLLGKTSAQSHNRLTIPPKVWFAFCGLEKENLLLNIVSEPHDPSEGEAISLEKIEYDWRK